MDKKKFKKAIAAAVIGNILEWYDFVLYAFFAIYISRNFFADSATTDSTDQLIKAFMIYGAAFVAKPLGAFILGSYGDKVGRKDALSITIILMALGVGIIAVTPSRENIGILAPILLLVARLLQGFSAGGEIGSATAFLLEYAPQNQKAFFASLFQSCMGIAAVLGSLVGVMVTSVFDSETIFAWAWRVPFFTGLLILPVGLYIRRTVEDTPEFLESINKKTNKKTPLKDIMRFYKKELFFGIVISVLWTVCPYVFVMFAPTFFMELGFDKNHVFIASMVANLCIALISPLSGKLADKFGMKKVVTISIFFMVLCNFPILWILFHTSGLLWLVFVHSAFLTLVAFFVGVTPGIISRIFPTEVRASGIALSYNFASMLTGFTPAFLAYATKSYAYIPAIYIALFAIPALFAIYFVKIRD